MKPVPDKRQILDRFRSVKGAVLVELAIMLPLMVALFVVVIDLGLILREHQIVQNAAREGARFGTLPMNHPNVHGGGSEARIRQRVVDYCTRENITIPNPNTNIVINQNHLVIQGGVAINTTRVVVTYPRALLIPASGLLPAGMNPVTLRGEGIFRNLY